MKVPGLFPETWTQTNKLAGGGGLEAAGVKHNNSSEGLTLYEILNMRFAKYRCIFLYASKKRKLGE